MVDNLTIVGGNWGKGIADWTRADVSALIVCNGVESVSLSVTLGNC